MKKLTFALACASTFALFAAVDAPKAGFEGYEAGATVADAVEPGTQALHWIYDAASGSSDGSTVKTYGGGNLAAPTTGDAAGEKYLELSTEGGTLWRSLASGSAAGEDLADKLGAAQAVPASGLYIDTMVQFTATEDGGTPETAADDKLAIWLNVDKSVTNLMVRANAYTMGDSGPEGTPTSFPLEAANGAALSVDAGVWYRLTVKAVRNVLSSDESAIIPGFLIQIDGVPLKARTGTPIAKWFGESDFIAEDLKASYDQNALFASLQEIQGSDATIALQAVGFKGSGALDNLAITEENPIQPPEMIDFTLTAAEGMTVEWSSDGKTWTAYAASAKAAAGTLYVRLTNADGAKKVVQKTLGADANAFDLSDAAFDWADYLGEAVNGAYVINDADELALFQKGYAAGLGTKGLIFALDADVALVDTWPGVGVAGAKSLVCWSVGGTKGITREQADANLAAFTADEAGAFQGFFDGKGHTVSNVKFARGDYAGFFQSCYNATVKNLKIALADGGWAAGETLDYGGGAVAGVTIDTALENCEVSGAFTNTKGAGGLVGYAGSGTVLKGCVNKATITSANEKVGGLIACAQNGNADLGAKGVVVESCQSLGDLECTTDGKKWLGGLVSYTDSAVTFKGANVVQGKLTQAGDTAVQSVIALSGGTAVVEEGATFTVPTGYKTVNKPVDGLAFATVADGVATLARNAAAVAGANLKVMAEGAPVALAAVGDAITLDETLAKAAVTTTAENAEVKQEGSVYTVVAKGATTDDWPEDPATVKDQTAEEAFGLTGELAEAEADALATWAKANGVAFAGAAEAIKLEAFLLNVANTAEAIEEGKANFKIPSITVKADGSIEVADPAGNYNGTIVVKGCATVNGDYTLEKSDAAARFFKAFLMLK